MVRRSFIFLLILGVGVVVSGYTYVHSLFAKKILAENSGACTLDSSENKDNPNRILFISCGGFM